MWWPEGFIGDKQKPFSLLLNTSASVFLQINTLSLNSTSSLRSVFNYSRGCNYVMLAICKPSLLACVPCQPRPWTARACRRDTSPTNTQKNPDSHCLPPAFGTALLSRCLETNIWLSLAAFIFFFSYFRQKRSGEFVKPFYQQYVVYSDVYRNAGEEFYWKADVWRGWFYLQNLTKQSFHTEVSNRKA